MAAGDWHADFGEWPLVFMRLELPEAGSSPRFETFEASIDAILDRRTRCSLVLNLSGSRPDADRRRRVVELAQARRESIERYVDRAALVVPSSLLRGALTAFRWLNPRPLNVEWDSFASERDAREWIGTRMRRAG